MYSTARQKEKEKNNNKTKWEQRVVILQGVLSHTFIGDYTSPRLKTKKKKNLLHDQFVKWKKGLTCCADPSLFPFFIISLLRVRFDVRQNSSFPFFLHLCCFYCFFPPLFCPIDLWGVWSPVTFLCSSKRYNSSSELLVAVRSHKYKWSRPSQKFSPRDLSDARVVNLFFFCFLLLLASHMYVCKYGVTNVWEGEKRKETTGMMNLYIHN